MTHDAASRVLTLDAVTFATDLKAVEVMRPPSSPATRVVVVLANMKNNHMRNCSGNTATQEQGQRARTVLVLNATRIAQ